MIIKTYINRNIYGKYFLATEAPEDEEVIEEQPKPRRNVKVISVKPSNRGKDFTEVEEEPVEEENETPETEESTPDTEEKTSTDDITIEPTENTPDTTEAEETPVEDNEPAPEENETPETQETTADTNEEPVDEGPDIDGDEDFTDGADIAGEETPAEGDETGEEGPDTGSDEDFADGADNTGEEAQPTEDAQPAQNTTPANNNAPGVDLDSMRKYNLFKEFMSLYNACDNYISKLETILKNDYEENQIIRISVNNLREIKDILSDYMTIRFRLNSYIQSLLFYQKMVVGVQLIFNMLRSINSDSKTSK